MKKFRVSLLVLILIFTMSTVVLAEEVTVTIPEYDVTVNGHTIDTEHSQYPVLVYKGITYFPMTSDYLNGIGLSLSFNNADGLAISSGNKVNSFEEKFLGASNLLGSSTKAVLAPFPVKVNGTLIDNSNEDYPVLSYKNITYFPMTWRFAVTEFGWTTSWDNSTGFGIEVKSSNNTITTTEDNMFDGYRVIEVAGGDLSGNREPNVAVNIGYGDREYWAFTNGYGQLAKVVAKEVVLQDESNEAVLSTGRYYSDEAKVPGTESDTLDEGHVIADSLGGVANAYNITPQNSTLNRHGDQAYMEKVIRDAGGCTDFTAIITYPDTKTQIPSHYSYTYTINGNVIKDDFDNVNPDKVNEELVVKEDEVKDEPVKEEIKEESKSDPLEGNLPAVDTNGNGRVTIAEAKAAGYSMPIYSTHWLYKYMTDRDGDGMVGE